MPKDSIVFVIEDDEAVRDALVCLLQSVKLQVKPYPDAVTFLKDYNVNCKGCIVTDIRMPKMSGLDLQETLNKLGNQLPIIFITGHGDVAMAVRAMKAGAFDFITKPFNNQLLLDQVQHAINLTPTIMQKINISSQFKLLTPREQEILNLVVDGKLNKEIAHILDISLSTVEMHRSHMMKKMQAKNTAELIRNYFLVKNTCGLP